MDYLLLRSPSANRVYTDEASQLAASELATAPFVTDIARPPGCIDYLAFTSRTGLTRPSSPANVLRWRRLSAWVTCFVPANCSASNLLDDDLVTIPKYQQDQRAVHPVAVGT